MHSPSVVVCLFCVTAGQNGENLGSDEEQIVLLAYVIYDVTNKQVVSSRHHYVKPLSMSELEELQQQLQLQKEQQLQPQLPLQQLQQQQQQQQQQQMIVDSILTEECKIQTGMDEEVIKCAPTLAEVLLEMETHIRTTTATTSSSHVTFLTDGPLHLRMCLIPEATTKEINLSPDYFRYYDLRKEVKRFLKVTDPINCLNDVLDLLEIGRQEEGQYGIKQCTLMSTVLEKMLAAGHVLNEPEIIKDKLEPGVCNKDEKVDEDTVVRARGLPWQSSDQDIARFFRGLNVEKGGVALCLSAQGRRNGEALVRFEGKEHRDLALRKHKHHICQRYIEVYKATGDDFIAVAGGSSTEAHEFLSRQSEGGCQIIIRMRGLPYVCSALQVLDFFEQEPNPVQVLDGEEGVLFVHQADGRATGDAFVLFATEEQAVVALSKHRQCIGSRYIELFKSTTAEVQQVLNRSLDPRANLTNGSLNGEYQNLGTTFIPSIITFPLLQPPPSTSNLLLPPHHQQLISSGGRKDCIRIRNLPLETQVGEILSFLGDHSKHIVYKGVHLVFNSRGIPSGEAFIQMDTEFSAQVTAGARNNKAMYTSGNKKHFIEVFQCSGDEMNMLLSNGLQPVRFPGNLPPTFTVCNFSGASNGHNLPIFIPTHLSPPPFLSNAMQTTNRHMITSASTSSENQEVSVVYNAPAISTFQNYQPLPTPTPSLPIALTHPPPPFIQPSYQTIIDPSHAPSSHHPTSNQQLVHPQNTMTPFSPLQPVVYWYPTPPISPQDTFYIPIYQATILIRGLPPTIHHHDILAFLEGQYEMPPDVQMVTGPDGRLTGDAYVSFSSRLEAESVVNKHVGKMVGGRVVEMFIV